MCSLIRLLLSAAHITLSTTGAALLHFHAADLYLIVFVFVYLLVICCCLIEGRN